MTQIDIYGYYGHNNAGDEAFKIAFGKLLPAFELNFLSKSHTGNGKRFVWGGGAILNDYFAKRIPLSGIVNIIGCSLPYGERDTAILDELRHRLAIVIVRSKKDAADLNNNGIPAIFLPDIVFSLDKTNFCNLRYLDHAQVKGVSDKKKKLICFLSDDYKVSRGDIDNYLRIESYKDKLAAILDSACEKFDVVMPSLSVWHSARDYHFSADVCARMKKKEHVTIVEKYIDPQEHIELICKEDAVVMSMKYHGLIFGMKAGKMVINIGSTRKNRHLMSDLDLNYFSFPYEKFEYDAVMSCLQKHNKGYIVDDVVSKVKNYKHDLENAADWIAKKILEQV